MGYKRILYAAFLVANLSVAILFMIVLVLFSFKDPVDFPVFYGASRNALHGLSFYTSFGSHQLPFWYFPWVSWIFLPLGVISQQAEWII